MQQVYYPRQEPSNSLPYLARPIAEHFYLEDEGEPDAYQLYPYTTNYDPGSPICESTFAVTHSPHLTDLRATSLSPGFPPVGQCLKDTYQLMVVEEEGGSLE